MSDSTQTTRDLKAIVQAASDAQHSAASPLTSAWVAASAGTGKTRVLTNRFLRLLLMGEPAESLLALTFTKAAAAEMANRITDELEHWAQSDTPQLVQSLTKLLDRQPTADEFGRARLLFTQSLGLPQGFNIQTIHSFCGGLLKRFPIEAGLAPEGKQIDEHGATALLTEVIERLAVELAPEEPERKALDNLLIRLTPEALTSLMAHVQGERARIRQALETYNGVGGVINAMAQEFGVKAEWLNAPNLDEMYEHAIAQVNQERRARLNAVSAAVAGAKSQTAIELAIYCGALLAGQAIDIGRFWGKFLTAKNEPTKRVIKEIKDDPNAHKAWAAEGQFLLTTLEQKRAAELIIVNRDFLVFSQRVINDVERLKRQRNVIDFDDMILLAAELLGAQDGSAQWVQYKLDESVRHLLVDEAQDTNPDQWRVIQALAQEFFAGQGTTSRQGLDRTLFVVGDLKQSIYSFQRADPELFRSGRKRFKSLADHAQRPWLDQPLTTTFRCAPAILDAVNAVFEQPGMSTGLSFDGSGWIAHSSARAAEAGSVFLHPPLIKDKRQTSESWAAAPGESLVLDETIDSIQVLASHIASEIAHWTAVKANAGDKSQWLSDGPDKARRVMPGDVLILLRKRGPFADRLIASLQSLGVPVAGADRLRLMDQLVIKDLLTLADASLQPADDLAVATILRSPLAPIDDQMLEDLAFTHKDNGQTICQALIARAKDDASVRQAAEFLTQTQSLARRLPAYEFFASVLYGRLVYKSSGQERFLARLGQEILDPLKEFLNQTRGFEHEATPTLQQFLVWIRGRDESIKRDSEASDGEDDDDQVQEGQTGNRGQVRVMTAHASKGLEAPIVILGDAFQKSTERFDARLIWQPGAAENDSPIPVWSPTRGDDSERTETLKQRIKDDLALEDRRLLYVAMTRAEERLHVFGMTDEGEKAQEAGWYGLIENGLKSLGDGAERLVQRLDDNREWRGLEYCWNTGFLNVPQEPSLFPEPQPEAMAAEAKPSLPQWVKVEPVPEPSPPRPLSPSRLDPTSEDALASPSPIDHGIKQRFLRGNLIHALFKVLPEAPSEQWQAISKRMLEKPGYDLTPDQIEEIISSVTQILTNPEFSDLFGIGSRAEVPVSGLVEAIPIAGQVDRLIEIRDQNTGQVIEVAVVDYKTNRPPPTEPSKIPKPYLYQMAAYAQILAQIYPDARIRPCLLWTDTAHLMEIPNWKDIAIPGAKSASPGQLSLEL